MRKKILPTNRLLNNRESTRAKSYVKQDDENQVNDMLVSIGL